MSLAVRSIALLLLTAQPAAAVDDVCGSDDPTCVSDKVALLQSKATVATVQQHMRAASSGEPEVSAKPKGSVSAPDELSQALKDGGGDIRTSTSSDHTAEEKAVELSSSVNMQRIPGVGLDKAKKDSARGMLDQFLREMKAPGYVPTPEDLAGATCLPGDFKNTSTPTGSLWTSLCFHLGMGWWSSDPFRQNENHFDIDTFVQCGAVRIGIKAECFGCLGELITQELITQNDTNSYYPCFYDWLNASMRPISCFYDPCGENCKTCSEPAVTAFKTCVGGNWVRFGQHQTCSARKGITTTVTTVEGQTTTPKFVPGFSDLPGPGETTITVTTTTLTIATTTLTVSTTTSTTTKMD